MTYIDMIIRLTVVLWRIIPMFPHIDTMKARLTYLYIVISSDLRLIPSGSLMIWDGWASKYAHPP